VLKQFSAFAETHRLFTADHTIILAVSGGLDSMVMLDLFRRARFSFVVAHVNFQLRGEESDDDEAFVRSHCSRLGVPFHCKRVETNNYATQNGLSLQMAARQLRYEWFDQLVAKGVGERVATAHHLTDSTETILLNLLRGAGPEGLTGIPIQNGFVIRPLMFATRAEIESYASAHAIMWREDRSNQGLDYPRNIVRNLVLPHLRRINPGLESTMLRTMQKAMGEQELVNLELREWQQRYTTATAGRITMAKEGFVPLSHPEALLLRLIEPYGFNFSNCIDILAAIGRQAGKTFLSSTHQLVIDRDDLILSALPSQLSPVIIAQQGNTSALGPYELSVVERKGNAIDADPAVAILDKDKISFPLHWRPWKEGDYFFPLGLNGRKKVSDFLVDLKLSIPDKQTVTVIESGKEIIWLPGLRIDDRFKVTPQTQTSLVLRVRMKVS
jgi:tRNA(Ile)-lysidine synthase